MVIAHRFNRIGHAATMKLLLIDFAPRFPRQREAQEAHAIRAGSRFAVRLERRLRGGDKEQPLQPQFLARRLRHEQVPEMHRIKRTTI